MHLDKRRPNAGKAAMWARYVLFGKSKKAKLLTVFSRRQAAAI